MVFPNIFSGSFSQDVGLLSNKIITKCSPSWFTQSSVIIFRATMSPYEQLIYINSKNFIHAALWSKLDLPNNINYCVDGVQFVSAQQRLSLCYEFNSMLQDNRTQLLTSLSGNL